MQPPDKVSPEDTTETDAVVAASVTAAWWLAIAREMTVHLRDVARENVWLVSCITIWNTNLQTPTLQPASYVAYF